jgi:hypothetical protein
MRYAPHADTTFARYDASELLQVVVQTVARSFIKRYGYELLEGSDRGNYNSEVSNLISGTVELH